MEHLSLGQPMEASIYPKYVCKICGNKLYTRKSPKTNWQEWFYTTNGQRHFKNRCNIVSRKKLP